MFLAPSNYSLAALSGNHHFLVARSCKDQTIKPTFLGSLIIIFVGSLRVRQTLHQRSPLRANPKRFTTAWSKNLVLRVLLPLHLRHPTEKGHGT